MPRYWVMAPYQSMPPDLFDKVWQFDLDENVISIGWEPVGNVKEMAREELAEAVALHYPDRPAQTQKLIANMLWAFYHEICPGDYVIARRGRKMLAGAGKVVRSAAYAPGKNPHMEHPGFLEVAWQDEPRDKGFDTIVFPMHTLAEITEEKFKTIIDFEDPNEFVLEKYLEEFIVSNFETIFQGRLKVFVDPDGNEGQQYATEIGPIDILAREPETRAFVVIELKKGRPSDSVVGQILRYMGWVKKNLCKNGEPVKGLIICRDHGPKLSYALEMTEGIEAQYYSVSFKLKDNP